MLHLLFIQTAYSSWLIIFCIAVAVFFSWYLYRKDTVFKDAPKFIPKLLTVFRFVSIFLITFFLLQPFLRLKNQIIEKPAVIIAIDNSSSLLAHKQADYYKSDFLKKLSSFKNSIADIANVYTIPFGDGISRSDSISYTEPVSDYYSVLNEVNNRFANKHVGALIVAGDGIYNRGMNPASYDFAFWFPVHTMAMGDSTVRKDVRIADVLHNKVVFKGNTFAVKTQILADKCKGSQVTYQVKEGNQVIVSKNVAITNSPFLQEIVVDIPTTKSGICNYTLQVSTLDNENNLLNNSRQIYVEVIENKTKVLVLYQSPHPDIAAITQTLSSNGQYEISKFQLRQFTGSIADYQVVLLHGIPSKENNASELIKKIVDLQLPSWIIITPQTQLSALNQWNMGVKISQQKSQTEESTPILNSQFSSFQLSENFNDFIKECPPLMSPFGEYSVVFPEGILMYQRLKNVNTQRPLFIFSDMPNQGRYCVTMGEGIWRWNLSCYKTFSNFAYFDELISKTIQFLSVSSKKERFSVSCASSFNENEPVNMSAELYDKTFQPDNRPDVNIELKDSTGKVFPYLFSRQGEFYQLSTGILKPGIWSYTAKVNHNGTPFQKSGSFAVKPYNLENVDITARFDVLEQLAANNNGKMFNDTAFDALENEIRNNPDMLPVSHVQYDLKDLIELKYLFFVLLIFLSVEWFLRKYFGSY